MNSATLPIEWWLSSEVIKRDPKWILFYEQTANEGKDVTYEDTVGRRYLCKIDDVVKFLQIFSPGRHRLMVMALGCSREKAKNYLERNYHQYERSLNWESGEKNTLSNDCLASTVVEFEVPAELFAEQPKSKLGQAMWQWVNRWHETAPADECAYRKRMILAFTAQPALMAIGWILKYVIWGTINALYVLLASIAVLFCGFRPLPILKEMWRALTLERSLGEEDWDVMRFGKYDLPYEERNSLFAPTFRVWAIKEQGGKKLVQRMRVAPFQVILYPILVCGALIAIVWVVTTALFWLLGLAALAFLIWGLIVFLKKKMPIWEQRWAQEEERERKMLAEGIHPRQQWLLENLSFAQVRPTVDLRHLPKPLTSGARQAQKFYVGFWTLKAKVCKPFSK